ncbi:hypothetical protein WJX81_005054 [Elliptochloris bilobata]|uniref:TLC domain-containing protein n=1 Tax=Elliptochloris bilobata TaxID=381761 RepID=A0AAW1RRW7_9CHLO
MASALVAINGTCSSGVAYDAADQGGLTTHLRATPVNVVLAGAVFLLFEWALLTSRWPRDWFLQKFAKANPLLTAKQLRERVLAANSRLVGTLHLIIQVPLAVYIICSPSILANKLYSRTTASVTFLAISAGYFFYDLLVSIFRYEGMAYLVHGAFAFILYTYGALSGALGYYGALFILWECSTPFVYLRWFLFNMGQAKSRWYIINGLLMLASFALFRNVLGVAMSVDFWYTSGKEMVQPSVIGGLSPAVLWTYRIFNCCLNALNFFWLSKMASGAVKVLVGGRAVSATVRGDS